MREFGQKVLVEKLRKNYRFEPVFIGKTFLTQERAGPFNSWPAPLKLRGPPLIIKGPPTCNGQKVVFSGESLFGESLAKFG